MWNPIFENLVGPPNEENKIVGYIAYGEYKKSKREWTKKIRDTQHRGPTDEELRQFIESWTESRIEGLKKEAYQIVAEFTSEVVEEVKPDIEREALRGQFWKGVSQSILGASLYTLLLIGIATVLRFAGIDFLSILNSS